MIDLLNIGRHQRLRTSLSSYVDGQVSTSEAARIEAHLSGCQPCEMDLENLRATVGLLRSMPELVLPRSFALDRAPEPAPAPWPLARAGGALAAAAAVLLIALLAGDLTGLLKQTGRAAVDDAVVRSEVAAMAADVSVEGEEPVEVERVVEREVVKEVEKRAATLKAESADQPTALSAGAPVAPEDAEGEAAPAVVAASVPPAAGGEAGVQSEDTPTLVAPRDAEEEAAPAPAVAAASAPLAARGEAGVRSQDAPAPVSAAMDEAEPDSRAIKLPLRQLELALAALLAASALAVLALALRRRRSP